MMTTPPQKSENLKEIQQMALGLHHALAGKTL
jgi:hypothetical protein